MIRPATNSDFQAIYTIINDAASAYKGVIPSDCYQEPYMPEEELREQISDGITFYCYCEDSSEVVGVMGIQHKQDVDLIRHAYVSTSMRNKGIGGKLLEFLLESSSVPILIGTWADAVWAIGLYQKYGFRMVDESVKQRLLRTYWSISDRQVETSVVLADERYFTTVAG